MKRVLMEVKVNWKLIYLTLILLQGFACQKDSGVEPTPRPEGWVFMGLADKEIQRVRLFGDYLYACAGRDGLFRINVKQLDAEWEFLGLADSTLPRRIDGVMDVAVYNKMILVAYSTPNPNDTGIFRAIDEEFNWQPSDTGILYGGIRILSQFPDNPQIVFAGSAGGTVYKSLDFGMSWKKVLEITVTGPVIRVIRFHPIWKNEIWVGGEWFDGAELWKSNNFGESWQDMKQIIKTFSYIQRGDSSRTEHTLLDIAFDPQEEKVFYIASSWVWKTMDGGTNWTAVIDTSGAYWTVAINPFDPKEMFVSGGRNLFRSIDSGMSWQAILPPKSNSLLAFIEVDWQNRIIYTHIFNNDIFNKKFSIYKFHF